MTAYSPVGEKLRFELPAAYSYLEVISTGLAAFLERFGDLPELQTTIYNLQLAVQEACTNIVSHAYEGREDGNIEVAVQRTDQPRRVIVDLFDTGLPFDPAQATAPDLSMPDTHGYGLFLMNNLVDEVHYAQTGGRNHWRLVKNV